MRTVFVNGCFDILHRGHIELFNFAKSHGDFLYIGIDSDERVKFLKGQSRPINSQEDRKFLLENIKPIDKVFIFNTEEDLIDLVKSIKPDIMVVGSDYKNKKVIGGEYAKQLLFFERIDEYSTTKIIQSSSNR
jgi:D-beta-D-heptose 7-phosphate kinase/D-beta-D-heptose 1-phosphate adenosyltransferase